jgi:ASC-1-like (ASCH) protein
MKYSDYEKELQKKWSVYESEFINLQKLMFQRFQGSNKEYQFFEIAREKIGIEAYTSHVIQLTERLARVYDFLKSTKGKNFGSYHHNALIEIANFCLYTIITLRDDAEKIIMQMSLTNI